MFTKANGVITLASGAPTVAKEAVDKFGHLMKTDHLTADEMAALVDSHASNGGDQTIAEELRNWTTTVNLFNPSSGEIAIEKHRAGGACDVGMERYWSI